MNTRIVFCSKTCHIGHGTRSQSGVQGETFVQRHGIVTLGNGSAIAAGETTGESHIFKGNQLSIVHIIISQQISHSHHNGLNSACILGGSGRIHHRNQFHLLIVFGIGSIKTSGNDIPFIISIGDNRVIGVLIINHQTRGSILHVGISTAMEHIGYIACDMVGSGIGRGVCGLESGNVSDFCGESVSSLVHEAGICTHISHSLDGRSGRDGQRCVIKLAIDSGIVTIGSVQDGSTGCCTCNFNLLSIIICSRIRSEGRGSHSSGLNFLVSVDGNSVHH